MPELNIGMIGLDTSHVPAFAKCFNKPDHAEHIPGARVSFGFPGGSKDFDLSINRVQGYTKQLRDEFDVQILDSPEAVAEKSDLVFITTCDGRIHRDLFARTVKFKKPTFIDKPIAASLADASEIFRLGKEHDVAVMSSSSLRYTHTLTEALDHCGDLGDIIGCDVFGPMEIHPPLPGLFWYGIHSVEMVSRILGRGCSEVRATMTPKHDLIALKFADGRAATIHGLRHAHGKFGAIIHRAKGPQFVNASEVKHSYYFSMLEAIMKTLPQNKAEVDPADTLEIVRIIEAANRSRESGEMVRLS